MATLNLKGGEITGNGAESQGGGILHNGNLNVSGSPVVKNNTVAGTNGNNIYLCTDHLINVTGSLSGDGNLGVTREGNTTGVITSGLSENGSVDSFFSDNPSYYIAQTDSGEASLEQYDAQVYGHTLTLEGQIGMNTYLRFGGKITSEPSDYQVEY